MLELVDAAEPPSRVVLGRTLPQIEAIYEERLATWRAWRAVSERAFGTGAGARATGSTAGSSTDE